MWKVKLCLGTGNYGISADEQIPLFAKTGFEGFFTGWKYGADLGRYRRLADEYGMLYQSVHAPFTNCAKLWKGGEEGDLAVKELVDCLRAVSDAEVPVMVSHAFIGFKDHTPTDIGIENFGKVFSEAEKLGVKIALENTEGEEYLDTLMNNFKGHKAVGFCLDTGHEMCYNRGRDLLAKYGSRLIATHINDNLGIRDFGGNITFRDDLHLLPFDGIGDFDGLAGRLAREDFEGPLTFELKKVSQVNRADNEKYVRMSAEEYITEAYARACRVGALYLKATAQKTNK